MAKSIFNTVETVAGSSTEGIAVTGATTYYSEMIGTGHSSGLSAHFQWTGTPTGTFTFWVSNKPNPSLTDDTDWVTDATVYTAVNPAGSASKSAHTITHRAKFKRFKYVNTSGTGVLYGWAHVNREA